MIRLRALNRDTSRWDSSPAEGQCSTPAYSGEQASESDTPSLVAAANLESEPESANAPVSSAADNTRTLPGLPPLTDDNTPEPASGSDEANNQETPFSQPNVGSNISWCIKFLGLTRTVAVLGLILAAIVGAVTWAGMNYANYYTKKSYDLALYQACRTYEDLQNSTTCRTVLATGFIRTRTLPDVRLGIGSVTTHIAQSYEVSMIAYLWLCENGTSTCLVRPSGPEVSYSGFISSIPALKPRLFPALSIRAIAIGVCRTMIFGLRPTFFFPTRFTSEIVQLPPPVSPSLWATAITQIDVIYALETGALRGQISWKSAVSWAVYFTATAALPILSAPWISYPGKTILLSTSVIVLAPLSAEITDIAANTVLLMTSTACFVLVLPLLRPRPGLAKGILQEEGDLRQTDTGQDTGAAELRDERSHATKSPRAKSSCGRQGAKSRRRKQRFMPPSEERPPTRRAKPVAKPSSLDFLTNDAFHFMTSNSFCLRMIYPLTRGDGAYIAKVCFYAICFLSFMVIKSPPDRLFRFPPLLEDSIIHRGGTLEDVAALNEAYKTFTILATWCFFISTVIICVVSQEPV